MHPATIFIIRFTSSWCSSAAASRSSLRPLCAHMRSKGYSYTISPYKSKNFSSIYMCRCSARSNRAVKAASSLTSSLTSFWRRPPLIKVSSSSAPTSLTPSVLAVTREQVTDPSLCFSSSRITSTSCDDLRAAATSSRHSVITARSYSISKLTPLIRR